MKNGLAESKIWRIPVDRGAREPGMFPRIAPRENSYAIAPIIDDPASEATRNAALEFPMNGHCDENDPPAGGGDPEGGQNWIAEALARYETPLIRYAVSLTHDLDAGRDIVQDTFLKLCQLPAERRPESLGPWLFAVCRNRALDRYRKEQRMTPLAETDIHSREGHGPSPSEHAETRDSADQLTQMLCDLPSNEQEVVRLKFHEQLSYQEISGVTGLSVTNVGFLLHTALKKLRAQMHRVEQTHPIH